MSAEMFENWPTTFEPPTRRVVDPAQPVLINVPAALGRSKGSSFRDHTPLKVRAEGLATDLKVAGTLHGWARTSTGDWLCCRYGSVVTV